MQDESDQDLRAGIIHLRVREPSQLFNSLDPSPFMDRDLDDDAVAYIVSWAREIPRGVAPWLRVELSERPPEDPQPTLESAVHNFFGWKARIVRNELRQLMRRGRVTLVIGLATLCGSAAVADALEAYRAILGIHLLQELVRVVGWVAMWRPVEIFLYDWWPVLQERRAHERLARMRVEVIVGAGAASASGPQPADH